MLLEVVRFLREEMERTELGSSLDVREEQRMSTVSCSSRQADGGPATNLLV